MLNEFLISSLKGCLEKLSRFITILLIFPSKRCILFFFFKNFCLLVNCLYFFFSPKLFVFFLSVAYCSLPIYQFHFKVDIWLYIFIRLLLYVILYILLLLFRMKKKSSISYFFFFFKIPCIILTFEFLHFIYFIIKYSLY